jgi:exodeoxyribonuclease V alpha subunit
VDELIGRVKSVIYEDGGFYILAFALAHWSGVELRNLDKFKMAKVRGHFHGAIQIKAGVPLKIHGEWTQHPSHGSQFNVRSWSPWAKNDDDIKIFLHNVVEGFLDMSLVDAVVAKYSDHTYDVLAKSAYGDFDPELLDQVARGSLGWQRMISVSKLGTLLQSAGAASDVIRKVVAHFGMDGCQVVVDDPYRILEIPGVPFHKVDRLGSRLGVSLDDFRRLAGALLWAIREEGKKGHLYVRDYDIKSLIPAGVPVTQDALVKAREYLESNHSLKVLPDIGVYPMENYKYEQESARILASTLGNTKIHIDLDDFVRDFETSNRLQISEHQRRAIEILLTSRVLVLTGLPGTGKTTLVKAFVRLFEKAGLSMRLMAPTGIAAKRLASLAGHDASTIHRALRYDGESWGYDENNRLTADAVIVDEMSMVDQELFYRLLSALPEDCTLVLVGDAAQLPSVGPGAVLRELSKCKVLPSVHLTKIFRQSVKGDIVLNAHRIYAGEMVQTEKQADSEFQFLLMTDEDLIADLIVEMAGKLKARDANFQVLSPKYEGTIGVDSLNNLLQAKLNPRNEKLPQREVTVLETRMREGDRVMIVKNDYDSGVYNGDVGKLMRITGSKLSVTVYDAGIDGTDLELTYTEEESGARLRLAYAITVHKCQGSEFDTIILPIVQSQGWMLQRNLLYTAVTRARKKVWLLGEEGAIIRAIRNDREMLRNTRLGQAILDHAGVA